MSLVGSLSRERFPAVVKIKSTKEGPTDASSVATAAVVIIEEASKSIESPKRQYGFASLRKSAVIARAPLRLWMARNQ